MFRCYIHENSKLFRLNVLQVLERICREPLGEIKNNGKKEDLECIFWVFGRVSSRALKSMVKNLAGSAQALQSMKGVFDWGVKQG
jgi:hypothetical protein